MNPNRRKLLENKLRRMVREELKNSENSKLIKETHEISPGVYETIKEIESTLESLKRVLQSGKSKKTSDDIFSKLRDAKSLILYCF